MFKNLVYYKIFIVDVLSSIKSVPEHGPAGLTIVASPCGCTIIFKLADLI